MTKEESIANFKASQDAAIGQVFDDGVASVPPSSGGGLSQSDIDSAVAAALAQAASDLEAVKAQDAQALADAIKAGQDQVDALTAHCAEVEGKLSADEGVIGNLKGSIEKLQSVLDVLKGL